MQYAHDQRYELPHLPTFSGKTVKRAIFVLIAIAVVALAVREGRFWYEHVHEPNARVQANFWVLASSVNGKLQELHVARGESVERGQLLASMDSRQAALRVESLNAEIARLNLDRAEAEAELDYFNSELSDRIVTATKEKDVTGASYTTATERLEIARKNVERNRALESKSVVAQQRLDDANDRLLEMTERVRELQADMTRSDLRLTELKGQRKRKAVFESRIAIIDGEIEKMTVELRLAKQKVEDMHIVSPIDGVLNRVHVNPGTYVEDGQPLMLLHDPADLWIEAKVEESNIRLIKVGQTVRIELDAYPFAEFAGTVRAIGRVTLGQQSGLEAPDSGNGVQRIRVDIELPSIGKPVWPGMRAAVNIVVRQGL